jgi:uncharacterized protein
VLVQWALRIRPRDRLARGWGLLAAAFTGVLTGMLNMGGPPIVLWAHAHRWSTDRIRVIVPALTLPLVPFQVALYLLSFGWGILPRPGRGAIYLAVVMIGFLAGDVVGRRIPASHFRLIAYGLLVLVCLSSMFGL